MQHRLSQHALQASSRTKYVPLPLIAAAVFSTQQRGTTVQERKKSTILGAEYPFSDTGVNQE